MRAAPLVLLLLAPACATSNANFRHLDPSGSWRGDNRARIDEMMRTLGRGSPGYDPTHRPVATFDWDNTNIRNDAGDATMYWMLAHDKIFQPLGRSWRRTSPLLTDAAVAALDAACGPLDEPGAPIATSKPPGAACATEIVTLYDRGKTSSGADGFSGYDHRQMEPQYAWATQLEAGYTRGDIRRFAAAALDDNLAAPIGATQTIGAVTGLAAWVRYYPEIHDLARSLQANGFDVWIISASSQPVAEVFAERNQIAADHVVGVRALTSPTGLLGYDLEGCGGVPQNRIITYIDGKRCFINKVIYHLDGPSALVAPTDPHLRQVFTAGDSDTDATFLRDASALRLVIDRNRPEVSCRAIRDEDHRWLSNPMFFDPLPPHTAPYPCSTSACFDSTGAATPCLDDTGHPLPDQIPK